MNVRQLRERLEQLPDYLPGQRLKSCWLRLSITQSLAKLPVSTTDRSPKRATTREGRWLFCVHSPMRLVEPS